MGDPVRTSRAERHRRSPGLPSAPRGGAGRPGFWRGCPPSAPQAVLSRSVDLIGWDEGGCETRRRRATRDYEQIALEILAEADAVETRRNVGSSSAMPAATEQPPGTWKLGAGGASGPAEARASPRAAACRRGQADPGLTPSTGRGVQCCLDEEHDVECRANADYEAYRARGRMKDGRRFGRPPNPYQPPETPAGKINLTDPDSRNVKTSRGWVQGYNAQAVCTEQQIVIAAEVTVDSPDFGHLEPMVAADARSSWRPRASPTRRRWCSPTPATGTRRRWRRITGRGTVVLIPPDAGKRKGARPGWDGGPYAFMRRVLASRPWRRALRQAPRHDRARLRAHEVQPPHGPLPTPRQIGRPV